VAELSELAWKLDDYLERGEEPPERLLLDPGVCEGELMSEEEIEEYIVDSLKAIRVLSDLSEGARDNIAHQFLLDMRFLLSIGRIDEDAYNELSNQSNFQF
jgi:hypothetical protein